MAKIKIISNPYKKNISFEKINDPSGKWEEININNSGRSELLNKDIVEGFFPFVVQKIIDTIISEYSDPSELLEIVFEGTEDEYYELEAVCKEDKYKDVLRVSRSDLGLENARDILDEVKKVFEKITPLVKQSVSDDKVERDLARFTDAANDVIPICILGNYSSGKSSFINALVGAEILPSGDEPVTAKVYRIEKGKEKDRAFVTVGYDGDELKIRFDDRKSKIVSGDSDKKLVRQLKKALEDAEDENMFARVNIALSVITEFVRDEDDTLISDMVEIVIPFVGGIWSEIPNRFVVFDTPGSNSASNEKHAQVLKQALKDLSNGLPVYISEYNTLDSTDNEKLYHELASMEEIDSRFTMIVVNKADNPKLPKEGYFDEENEQRLLSLSTPRNLYSEGIYFVSSVMGLGSKCDGEFIDEHYAEMFESLEPKFSNPSSRFYKTLYKYNIMPKHLKNKSEEASEKQSNLIYANSGLYAVEMEIATFASKYSSYNKCEQSKIFLNKIIGITSDEIEGKHKTCVQFNQDIHNALDHDKRQLLERIEEVKNHSLKLNYDAYDLWMDDAVKNAKVVYDVNRLKEYEAEFIEQEEKNLGYSEHMDDAKEAASATRSNFVENVKKAFKEHSLTAIKEIGSDMMEDIKEARESSETAKTTKREADSNASDALLRRMNNEYRTKAQEGYDAIQKESELYWETKARLLREELVKVVTDDQALEKEKKEQLTQLILEFDQATLESEAVNVFLRGDFEKGVRLFNVFFGNADRLNLNKLTKKFNEQLADTVQSTFESVKSSHQESIEVWANRLYDTIRDNVASYNPGLREKTRMIENTEREIEDLESRKQQLMMYTKQIENLMDWKEM